MPQLRKILIALGLFLLGSIALLAFLNVKQSRVVPWNPQHLAVTKAADKQAISSVRRPFAAGFYDAKVKQTFFSWIGENSNPYVQAYDHTTGTVSAAKRVGRVDESIHFDGPDHHNYPQLIQAADGRLLVIYAEHSDELRLASSAQASSLEGTWSDTVIQEAPWASYPMPVRVANGDLYIFYRESTFNLRPGLEADDRPLQYVVSRDNGVSWQSSRTLVGADVALGSLDRSDNLDEIYVGQIRYQPKTLLWPERIHLVWTLAGGGPEGAKHDRYHKDVYYAYFQPAKRHFYCAGGKDMGVAIDSADMATCLVEDSGPLNSQLAHAVGYIQLVHFSDRADPLIIYRLSSAAGSMLKAARWTGKAWAYSNVAENAYALDIEKLDSNSFLLYTTYGTVKRYLSNDGGASWQELDRLTLPDDKLAEDFIIISGYQEPAHILVSEISESLEPSSNVYLLGEKR